LTRRLGPGMNFFANFLAKKWLTFASESVSFLRMRPERIILRRQKFLDRLPVTGEILRGSLLERTIRNHASGCAKCASGEGHPLSVLTVTYPGGRTRQFSLRRERVSEVRRWLRNYQQLKEAIEAICELNHELLRPDKTASKTGRKRGD
jgi:hypothetical protein